MKLQVHIQEWLHVNGFSVDDKALLYLTAGRLWKGRRPDRATAAPVAPSSLALVSVFLFKTRPHPYGVLSLCRHSFASELKNTCIPGLAATLILNFATIIESHIKEALHPMDGISFAYPYPPRPSPHALGHLGSCLTSPYSFPRSTTKAGCWAMSLRVCA